MKKPPSSTGNPAIFMETATSASLETSGRVRSALLVPRYLVLSRQHPGLVQEAAALELIPHPLQREAELQSA